MLAIANVPALVLGFLIFPVPDVATKPLVSDVFPTVRLNPFMFNVPLATFNVLRTTQLPAILTPFGRLMVNEPGVLMMKPVIAAADELPNTFNVVDGAELPPMMIQLVDPNKMFPVLLAVVPTFTTVFTPDNNALALAKFNVPVMLKVYVPVELEKRIPVEAPVFTSMLPYVPLPVKVCQIPVVFNNSLPLPLLIKVPLLSMSRLTFTTEPLSFKVVPVAMVKLRFTINESANL